MLKFLLGIVFGAAMAFGYVRWNVGLPEFLGIPDKLKGNIISTAGETDLYDLDRPMPVRKRALEILFRNRAGFAASVDQEFGYPFLKALYRKRVIREARQLRLTVTAIEHTLKQDALRANLERKHATKDPAQLKQRMLLDQFRRSGFLARWVDKHVGPVTEENLLSVLKRLSVQP
ncbi:MAG: hypothetical protein ACR2O4_15665 [Hyphomicrobiaceae bacterium]